MQNLYWIVTSFAEFPCTLCPNGIGFLYCYALPMGRYALEMTKIGLSRHKAIAAKEVAWCVVMHPKETKRLIEMQMGWAWKIDGTFQLESFEDLPSCVESIGDENVFELTYPDYKIARDRAYFIRLLERHDSKIAAAKAAGLERVGMYKILKRLGLK